MKRHLAITLCIYFFIFSFNNFSWAESNQFHENDNTIKIDEFIQHKLEKLRIPGLAIGIIKNNEIIYLGGFGKTNQDNKKVTPQTPFLIGSLSKSITALAVMQLVEAGKLDLNVPIQRYIPWFQTKDLKQSSQITAKHLLYQTSGLPYKEGVHAIVRKDIDTLYEHIRKMENIQPFAHAGSSFQYSNLNYLLLGYLIEEIAGDSYNNYIKQNIFEPLRMEHSTINKKQAEEFGMASGYMSWFGMPFSVRTPDREDLASAAAIFSTAEDMAKYLLIYLTEGQGIVTNEGVKELLRPGTGQSNYEYAMGWFYQPLNNRQILRHGGDMQGYHAQMVIVPDEKLGLIVLTNLNGIMTLVPQVEEISLELTGLLLGDVIDSTRSAYMVKNYLLLALVILLISIPVIQILSIKRWYNNLIVKKIKFTQQLFNLCLIYLLAPIGIILFILKTLEIPLAAVQFQPDLGYSAVLIMLLWILKGIFKVIVLTSSRIWSN